MAEEAYRRYAIAASLHETTYLARFRTLAKRYPAKAPSELLADLVASAPGDAGKWFAAAKSAGLFEEAIALATAGPADPKTLTRAARDFADKRPEFALKASLAALYWFAEGYGYEITSLDVVDAYNHGLRAAEQLARVDDFKTRAAAIIAAGDAFVRESPLCATLRTLAREEVVQRAIAVPSRSTSSWRFPVSLPPAVFVTIT